MGRINNTPKIKDNQMVNVRRSDIGQRAEWLFYMYKAAKEKGVDLEEIARNGIYEVGCVRGDEMMKDMRDKSDLQELCKCYYENLPGMKAFEKTIEKDTPEEFIMDFHYCPLVAAWQKHTDDEELIKKLCDIAMDGDRGIFSRVPGAEFHLDSTIASGAPVCRLRMTKKAE